ncbi:MAG: trypsin-like serine protease [Cypionkella sp.]|uniref:trypsin-like serine peptidase n=1 Tax=Cypionkella sp. TaxID=2811411 RepID=UPI00262B8D37|nr:trypsin-like peptidase domain-containing protein [Cypionkella sp.]MDB5661583.1 trypsin-like serine protease [Cypionkella sp.]
MRCTLWSGQVGCFLLLFAAGQGNAQQAPLAVGRISYGDTLVPGAAICTGALVAPDLVLTARHCVEPALTTPATIRFAANFSEGHSLAERRGAEMILPQAGVTENRANDVALLRLEAPIAVDVVATLPIADPALAQWLDGLSLIAYRRDAPDQPQRGDDCELLTTLPGILALSCPVVSGNSGAPILAWDGTEWQIVAVMVAASSGRPVRSLAATIPADLLAWITSAVQP